MCMKCDKTNFWFEKGVLFCRFEGDECKKVFNDEFLVEFFNKISTLSKGGYYPLLLDLRQLKQKYACSLIKIIANNPELKTALLSKSFVVSSYFVQFSLIASRKIHDPIIPNKVFTDYDKAIAYSTETNYIFNAPY